MSIDELLSFYRERKLYWYLVPRAFWPYPESMEGIPGFHYFLKRLMEYQENEKDWNRDKEMEILIMLEDKGITPIWEEQEDYHAHFRNRVNFAKKMGFALPGENRPLALTPVGKYFLESDSSRWPEIFEHQLIKLEFTNPSMPDKYSVFSLFPYMFTVSLLLELDYLSLEEFIFRVSLIQNYDEREETLDWIYNFRKLSETEIRRAATEIDLNHSYSARMIFLLFAYTPSLDFVNNALVITDKDRLAMLFTKCWPNLTYTKYDTIEEWINKFGNFDYKFWPLLSETAQTRLRKYKAYSKREESEAHKEIKKYIIENCKSLFGKGAKFIEEEYSYASGDRANLIFSISGGKFLTVEVEVDIAEDEITGLLQAIKYKYMYAAQENISYEQVLGMLAARKIHPRIKEMCVQYGIYYYEKSTNEKSFDWI